MTIIQVSSVQSGDNTQLLETDQVMSHPQLGQTLEPLVIFVLLTHMADPRLFKHT